MVATPLQVIAPLLLGLLALAALIAAVFLLLRIRRIPAVAVWRRDVTALQPMSRDAVAGRRRTMVAIALALILCVVAGRSIVLMMRPSTGDAPQDTFGPVTRRLTGPSGANLAIEESGP